MKTEKKGTSYEQAGRARTDHEEIKWDATLIYGAFEKQRAKVAKISKKPIKPKKKEKQKKNNKKEQ